MRAVQEKSSRQKENTTDKQCATALRAFRILSHRSKPIESIPSIKSIPSMIGEEALTFVSMQPRRLLSSCHARTNCNSESSKDDPDCDVVRCHTQSNSENHSYGYSHTSPALDSGLHSRIRVIRILGHNFLGSLSYNFTAAAASTPFRLCCPFSPFHPLCLRALAVSAFKQLSPQSSSL
jgi:hypothetical protein